MNNKPPNDNAEPKKEIIHTRKLKQEHIESFLPIVPSGRQQHKRILIVDDSSDIAFTLKLGLENNDTAKQVYSYDNPVNALSDFKPNFYDLLLIDINMPLMNGFELCEKLLQQDLNVKVCFMTSGEINIDAAREVHPLVS